MAPSHAARGMGLGGAYSAVRDGNGEGLNALACAISAYRPVAQRRDLFRFALGGTDRAEHRRLLRENLFSDFASMHRDLARE